MQIRSHVQTGSVQAYVYKFRELMANIPSMNMDEAYHLFITGLQPHLRQLVGTLVPKNDLEAAIDMAQRSTAYGGAQMGRQEIGGGRGQQQNRPRRGQVSQIQQPSSQSSEGDFTSTTTVEGRHLRQGNALQELCRKMARASAKSVGISLKRLSGLTSVSFVMNQDTLYGIAQRQRPCVRRLNREMHSLLSCAHEWSAAGGSFWDEH